MPDIPEPEVPKKKPMQVYEYYSLEDAVPTQEEIEQQYGGNYQQLCEDHEKIIEQILEEEEGVIIGHRKHIDDVVDLVKQEMAILNNVDKPGSDISTFVKSLDTLLLQKLDMIHNIRQQLVEFNKNLKTEETMSILYEQQQPQNDFDDNQQPMADYDQQDMEEYG